MFCHKCGTKNQDTARYCKKCGVQLKKPESVIDREHFPQKNTEKNSKKIIYIIGVAVILLAIVAAVIIGVRSKRGKEYETYLASAEKYIEELNYEQAEDFYLKAIEIAPKKLKPYVELAEVYIFKGELEKAKSIIKKAEDKNAKGDEGIQIKLEKIIVLLEAAQNMVDYQWVVEPTIEAEDIYYLRYMGGDMNEPDNLFNKQLYSQYAIINSGNGVNLIDMKGRRVLDAEYKEIQRYYSTYLLRSMETFYHEGIQQEWDLYSWDEEYGLQVADGFGGPGTDVFYYYNGIHALYGFDELHIPNEAMPVQQGEGIYGGYEQTNQWGYEWLENQRKKYGIFCNGELTADFIYDECGSSAEGLLAVCKDDKWGYVDEKGEIVIPLEYDASWKQYDKGNIIGENKFIDYCYAASDGYVTLCKDEEWELRDVLGEVVIPAGIFEKILPVYEGKCWVKQAGRWGVIELLPESNVSEEIIDMTEFFGALPREFFFSSGAGAWSTELEVRQDGTFIGYYHDSDMGDTGEGYPNGTRRECGFSGKFTVPEKISEYIYRMKIDYIETEISEGEIYFEDGIRCVGAEPYGMETDGEFYVYLPGAPVDEMIPDFLTWTHGMVYETDQIMPEGSYGIYNTSGAGFVSSTSFQW